MQIKLSLNEVLGILTQHFTTPTQTVKETRFVKTKIVDAEILEDPVQSLPDFMYIYFQ